MNTWKSMSCFQKGLALAICFAALLLTVDQLPAGAQTIMDKYRRNETPGADSREQDKEAVPDLINVPDSTTHISRKDFEEVLESPFKLSYKREGNTRHAYVNLDFLLIFHPRMARYIPELGCFAKAREGENLESMRARILNSLLELHSSENSETPELKTVNREITELGRLMEQLTPDMNKELAEASRKFKFTDSEGNTPEAEELAKLQDDYQARLKEIMKNYGARRDSLNVKLEEKTALRRELLAQRDSKLLTTPSETASQFLAMLDEIRQMVNEYCEKSGHELVFNSSLRKPLPWNASIPGTGSAATQSSANPKARPDWSETKGGLYAEFLEKKEILRVQDSGHLTVYTEALKDWYESNSRLHDRMAALQVNPMILAGGQDITREILYLSLKKFGIPAEKNQLIIDLYNSLTKK